MRGTGRGIFLIRSLMDEVQFRQLHPGTEMTLVKHLAVAGKKVVAWHGARTWGRTATAAYPASIRPAGIFNNSAPRKCYNRSTNKEEIPWHLLLLPVKWTA